MVAEAGLTTTDSSSTARLNGVVIDAAETPVLGRVLLDEENTLQTYAVLAVNPETEAVAVVTPDTVALTVLPDGVGTQSTR